jgi:integrase
VATDRAESDPTRDLRGVALPPANTRHHAAVTEPEHLAKLLRAIRGYRGSPIVRIALQLAPLVFVRPGELRQARWSEIELDGDAPTWSIPAERMKMREAHLVPLSRQAVALLREPHPLTGNRATNDLVFRGARDHERPMSENTFSMALESLGYYNGETDPHGEPVPVERRHSPHGFRATARTLLDERLHERVDLVEHQLAHAVKDPLGRAYNRTRFLDERRVMMQRWADYLDELATGAKVILLDEQRAA